MKYYDVEDNKAKIIKVEFTNIFYNFDYIDHSYNCSIIIIFILDRFLSIFLKIYRLKKSICWFIQKKEQ